MLSDKLRSVPARVVHDAPGDLVAIRSDNRNDVAVFKFIFDARDAGIKEAGILLRNRIDGAFVDVNPARNR